GGLVAGLVATGFGSGIAVAVTSVFFSGIVSTFDSGSGAAAGVAVATSTFAVLLPVLSDGSAALVSLVGVAGAAVAAAGAAAAAIASLWAGIGPAPSGFVSATGASGFDSCGSAGIAASAFCVAAAAGGTSATGLLPPRSANTQTKVVNNANTNTPPPPI